MFLQTVSDPKILFNLAKYCTYTIIVMSIGMLGLLYLSQNSMLYPSDIPVGSRRNVAVPSDYGMTYERIELVSKDGTKLDSFLIPAPKADYTLLYFHANAGNMGHRLPIAKVFNLRCNANIFIISYRGYGKSKGEADEKGMKLDGQAALDFCRTHPTLKNTKIVIYGQSIGGAVAIYVASRNQVDGLILENTFLSIDKVIPYAMPWLRFVTFLCHQKWPSQDYIGAINCPILFLGGSKDELVPPSHMQTLYEMANSKSKRIVKFEDGTHNDTIMQPGYFEAVYEFWESLN